MSKIDSDAERVFNGWLDFLLPDEMTPKELESLAKKAKLSAEALRKLKNRNRRGMSTETLIRLALCRGATASSLISSLLQVDKKSSLDQSEIEWITYGASLPAKKRKEFLDFIKYMRSTWNI
ncbi:MAG: hypothetical protein H6625_12435 [Bdellovibrionaceae bacterium]|nr:hypothetical protein [Pseudobdellovibrionaceae bacterium]